MEPFPEMVIKPMKIQVSHLESLPITARAEIPTAWLDEMKHMNVMWYTHLFSHATVGFFDRVGMSREYFLTKLAGSFALEAHIKYFAEVHAGWNVTLRTRFLGRSAKRFHFMHFLSIDEDDVLSATGEMVSTHVDLRVRRSSPFPPEIAAAYDALLGEHRQLAWEAPVCGSMGP